LLLSDLAPYPGQLSATVAPAWALGCFSRRSITWADNTEDSTTRVVWLQTYGMTGDLRVPAARPDLAGVADVCACSRADLMQLARAEGGVADSSFGGGGRMTWHNWVLFQSFNTWPEPGDLRRVGSCLVEFAPGGAYVEDWRAQPDASGLLVGLRLVSEAVDGLDRYHTPRDGGLLIAGGHAMRILGRRRPLTSQQPLPEQFATCTSPSALAAEVFDASVAYARRLDGTDAYTIELSTNPFEEGREVSLLDGFAPAQRDGFLVQRVDTASEHVERVWRIDTLLHDAPTLGQELVEVARMATPMPWV
jgi:hypothetical protein